MKILRSKESGSIMVFGLVTSAVLIIGLASYFSLVQSQNNSVIRSQVWNSAIPAAEAGIEDALAHLNTIGDSARSTNGYVLTNNMFVVTRQLANYRYTVGIQTSNQPAIISTGYVRAPNGREISRIVRVQSTRTSSGMRGLVAINGLTMNGNVEADSFDSENPLYSANGAYISSKRRDSSFAGSVNGNIDTGGGRVYGYMATGPNGTATGNAGTFAWFSTNSGTMPGHWQKDFNVYYPPVNVPFSGGASYPTSGTIVTTNYTFGSTLITTNTLPSPAPASYNTLTNTYTQTAYPTGRSSITTNVASMSSKTMPAAGTYVGNVVTRNVTSGPPANRGTWYDYQGITGYNYKAVAYQYTIGTTNYTTTSADYRFALGNGNFQMNELSMSGQDRMIVTGDATLYVVNGFSMTGQTELIIAPGGSLKIYVGGSANLAGNGIFNNNGNTSAFSYYGLPGNTSIALSGNAAFTGTIYAPNANFSLNGGGNNTYDMVGAIVAKTIDMHGHFNFHYDEKLGRTTGPIRYRVASWNEL